MWSLEKYTIYCGLQNQKKGDKMEQINKELKKEGIFMPKISERTKNNLSKIIGTSYENIVDFELDEEIAFIEAKTGKKVVFSKDTRLGRGNPRLATGRIKTMEEVENEIKRVTDAK